MRNKLFKILVVGIVAGNMLYLQQTEVFANEVIEQQEIISRNENSSQNLTITGSTANLTLIYNAEIKVDSIVVSVRLQKYIDGTWKRVKIWDDVKYSTIACKVSKSCQVTSSGRYRAKFVVTTKKGNSQKTENFYSNVVNY